MTGELQRKVNGAIRLLRSVGDTCVEVCYSGGKDSDVILELAKMAGINFRAIYRCTTIDPPHTISYVKSKGAEVTMPKTKFFELVRRKGFPTMRARFCCDKLKEYKILDNAVQGIRRCESTKRMSRYKEPIVCRIYGAKANHVNVLLPILEWTDNDMAEFIAERGIKCHPLYYDESGKFHVERRLGCLGCPLLSDRGLSDFKQYPNLVKAWIRAGQQWWETHPDTASHRKFADIYELFYHNVFCASYADFLCRKSQDLWGNTLNCKAYLEKCFNIKFD